MSSEVGKISLNLDPALCSPPEGATLEILLGQIFMLFDRQRKDRSLSSQPCAKCSLVKENFRKYKSLTQRRIEGLESQLSAAKEKLSQSRHPQRKASQPSKPTALDVLAEDSTLFDTPEKRFTTNEEVPETQQGNSPVGPRVIPLVLKYEHVPKAPQKSVAGRASPAKKLLDQQAKARFRKEPSWIKREPQSPKAKREKIGDENIVRNCHPESGETASTSRTENLQPQEAFQPTRSSTTPEVPECVECRRFFKDLDPGLARSVKRCSKHRHKPEEAVVPSEMWRTKMQDTIDLKAAGVCDDTLPCDLKPSKFKKKGLF